MISNHLRIKYIALTLIGLLCIFLQLYTFSIYHRPVTPCLRYDTGNASWLKTKSSVELSKDNRRELKESIQQRHQNRSCSPHTNIFFLKTHKTASCSIINILFRYGEFHNLTFALPFRNDNQFLYPDYFFAHFVDGFYSQKWQNYNVLCHHMRLQLTEVIKVMPRDAFYFTILRHPASLMESSFAYFKTSPSFAKAKSLKQFLSNPEYFYKSHGRFSGFAKNLMTFDLGFDHNGPESAKYLQFVSSAVDTMFDLVLITEYFDESLVLLKDALCWTLDDVLSFPLNMRNSSKLNLSARTTYNIKRWNHIDWHLYTHFNRTFWNQIDRFGKERMREEVAEIRRRRREMMEKCLENQADPSGIKDKSMIPYQSGLHKILSYNLKPDLDTTSRHLCHRLVLPEVQYTALLAKKQEDSLRRHRKMDMFYRRFTEQEGEY